MAVRVDIVSIGTLARNRIWGETQAVRTPHSTTTLIRATPEGPAVGGRERRILVDPGLPAAALAARLFERTGLKPDEIDVVFCTCFRPAHREGISLFEKADWLLSEPERDAVREHLDDLATRSGDADVAQTVRRELALLERFAVPDGDKLAAQVDLFPMPGFTPGLCGLLVAEPTLTTLVSGAAVATRDHLLAAQVLPDSFDANQAAEALREVYEIADQVVPGYDNAFPNPRTLGG